MVINMRFLQHGKNDVLGKNTIVLPVNNVKDLIIHVRIGAKIIHPLGVVNVSGKIIHVALVTNVIFMKVNVQVNVIIIPHPGILNVR